MVNYDLPKSPALRANCVSRAYLWWLNGFFWKGFKRNLQLNDLYEALPEDQSENIGNILSVEWDKELERCAQENKKAQIPRSRNHKSPKQPIRPSLLRAISKVFLKKFFCVGLLAFFEECCIKIVQPIALGYLIRYFTNKGTKDEYERYFGYITASTVTVCAGLLTLFHHPYFFGVCHVGMKVRVGCCSLIYRKAMRLSQASLQKTAIGQMVNLLSNDVNRFDMVTIFLHYLWIGPAQTAIIIGILWFYYGPSCIVGLVLLILFVPFQGFLGSRFSKLRDKTAVRTDRRIRYMNEVVSGIRVIKMYSWESPFSALIGEAREDEIKYVRKTANLRALNMTLFFTSSKVIVFLTLLTFVLLKHELSAELVFVTVSLYNNVRLVMTLFYPNAVSQYAETQVSIRRLEDFLLLDEREGKNKFHSIGPEGDSRTANEFGVVINDISAKWWPEQKEYTLENISLTVHTGKVLAIIGPVGSGKGSILHTILKELPVISGRVEVTGSTAYAAQEPWLFSGSVRENILLGQFYREDWYRQVIKACALEHDLDLLPYGDSTLVGERGSLLSGGQKARIALARAAYANSDVYLLDDPLSAVDAEVGVHLFNKCIKGLLSNKATILVTHQLQFVNQCDYIIILEEGAIRAEGTFADLERKGINFDKMTQVIKESLLKVSSTTLKPKSPVATTSKTFSATSSSTIRSISVSSKQSRSSSYTDQSPIKYEPVALLNNSDEFINSEQGGPTAGRKYWQDAVMDGILVDEVNIPGVMPTDDAQAQEEKEEIANVGSVKFTLYCKYFRAGSSCCSFLMLIIMNIVCQIFYSGADYWLNLWTNAEELKNKNILTYTDRNNILYYIYNDRNVQIYGYTIIVVLLFVTSWIRTLMFFWLCMKSSTNLHKSMFKGIIRAPIQFFEANSSGRILNRFSKDMGQIDDALPQTFFDTVAIFLNAVAIVAIIAIINPFLLIPSFILLIVFYFLRLFYLRTARSIKRLEGIARSPVFSHLSTSLYGLTTIRAFGSEKEFIRQFDTHQDLHSSSWYLFLASTRWFGIWLDFVSVIYIGIVALSFMFMSASGAGVGLAVSSAMMLSGMFQWGVRQSAEVENQMVSVERILEYSNLESEAALTSSEDKKPPQNWPSKGEISFDNLYLYYDSNPVLKDITCTIKGSEKIGIVGRTGAGKSTFITVLFRMAEPTGRLTIDGIDISKIGLHDLRSKISIIPQEPVLFSGTLRKNVDPFGIYSDSEVWAALEQSHLAKDIRQHPKGIEADVSEGGSNFSVGQRQLLCLARAILRNNTILVLDEATANVDLQTDSLIQKTIRTRFKNCTVLTVAHRLHTVMDCDRILVLDSGRVMEFDEPFVLLQNKGSHLRHLVNNTGSATAVDLTRMAAIAHKTRQAENKDPASSSS